MTIHLCTLEKNLWQHQPEKGIVCHSQVIEEHVSTSRLYYLDIATVCCRAKLTADQVRQSVNGSAQQESQSTSTNNAQSSAQPDSEQRAKGAEGSDSSEANFEGSQSRDQSRANEQNGAKSSKSGKATSNFGSRLRNAFAIARKEVNRNTPRNLCRVCFRKLFPSGLGHLLSLRCYISTRMYRKTI